MNKIHYTRDKIMSDEDKRQIFFLLLLLFLKFYMQGNAKWRMNPFKKGRIGCGTCRMVAICQRILEKIRLLKDTSLLVKFARGHYV